MPAFVLPVHCIDTVDGKTLEEIENTCKITETQLRSDIYSITCNIRELRMKHLSAEIKGNTNLCEQLAKQINKLKTPFYMETHTKIKENDKWLNKFNYWSSNSNSIEIYYNKSTGFNIYDSGCSFSSKDDSTIQFGKIVCESDKIVKQSIFIGPYIPKEGTQINLTEEAEKMIHNMDINCIHVFWAGKFLPVSLI